MTYCSLATYTLYILDDMRVIFDTRIVKRMNNELATAQYAVESAGVCVVGRTAALYTVRQKKLHRFIFAIALSERRLL